MHRHPALWRTLSRLYLFVWIPLVPLYPIIASEYTVCIPLLMVYLAGFGPVLSILNDPAACQECDADVHVEPRGVRAPSRRA